MFLPSAILVLSAVAYYSCSEVEADKKCSPVMCENVSSQKFSRELSYVHGPGLRRDFRVPARYFFLQAVNTNGQNFTESPPGKVSAQITGTREHCSVWTQVLDKGDGTFIIRYKLFRSCPELKIELLHDGLPLFSSPYIIKGPILQETCFCPNTLHEWLGQIECKPISEQILKDLKPFPKIDMDSVLKSALKRFNRPGAVSFCHYSVIKNQVYRKCYGQHVGFNMFMDEILLSLTRKVSLPDVEMLVNLGDWPLEHGGVGNKDLIPFMSWCGSEETYDIVMPTYDLTESSLEMMGRVMIDIFSVQANSGPKWDEKTEMGFWRGRDSRQERLDLVKLSRQHTDLINASLTNFFFFRDKMEEYGPKVDHISFFEFFKFKYQINIDGTVAAYRLPYLIAGKSVVLKHESEYYEHFYPLLKPYVHYVPFKKDLSDLVEKLEWLKHHDQEAQEISRTAQQFVMNNLLPQDVFCYYTQLLQEYSKRLVQVPKVRGGMEHVPQPQDSSPCACEKSQVKDEL